MGDLILPPVPPVVTGNEILDKLQRHLGAWWFNNNWLPTGMIYTSSTGTGGFNWSADRLIPYTGTTLDSYAMIGKSAYGLSRAVSWDKKRWFGVLVRLHTYSAQNIHIVTGYCPTTGSANTYRHIGFKLINADLYGTVGNGTYESTLLLETLTAGVFRRLECVLDPGVECRFYLDGVDKGAITTNLPTGTINAGRMLWATVHNTEALDKRFYLYEARTFQYE